MAAPQTVINLPTGHNRGGRRESNPLGPSTHPEQDRRI